jgi:hypothetical protein
MVSELNERLTQAAPQLQLEPQRAAAPISGEPSNHQSAPRRQRDAQGGSARAALVQPRGRSV